MPQEAALPHGAIDVADGRGLHAHEGAAGSRHGLGHVCEHRHRIEAMDADGLHGRVARKSSTVRAKASGIWSGKGTMPPSMSTMRACGR
ncbi:hypothetical protein D9M68_643340 [compost metagenome]